MDLFEQPEHIPVDILNVTDGDFCPVCHYYSTFHAIQLSHIAGDRHIAASGFLCVRQEVRNGYTRLFLDVLFNDSRIPVIHNYAG